MKNNFLYEAIDGIRWNQMNSLFYIDFTCFVSYNIYTMDSFQSNPILWIIVVVVILLILSCIFGGMGYERYTVDGRYRRDDRNHRYRRVDHGKHEDRYGNWDGYDDGYYRGDRLDL